MFQIFNYINLDYCICNFMYLSGLIVFCSLRKHLLLTLLSLEYLVLALFMMLFMLTIYYESGSYFILVFLTFSVCEGSLGLAVLVSMVRCHGNDNIMSMNMVSW